MASDARAEARVLNELVRRHGVGASAVVIGAAIEQCINRTRKALVSLQARKLAVLKIIPSKFSNTAPEREWTAAPGAEAVPVPPPYNNESRIAKKLDSMEDVLGLLADHGELTSAQVAIGLGVTQNNAGRKLLALLKQKKVVRREGPMPDVGSVRPWLWREA